MQRRLADAILILTTLLSGIELGGGIYEGLVIFPAWSAAPPASFALLQGPDGLQVARFWLPLHILLTLALVPTLVLNWRSPRRRALVLVGLAGYLLMRATTFAYFLPELTAFLATPPDGPYSAALAARAARWGALSAVRVAVIAGLALVLLLAAAAPFAGRGRAATMPARRAPGRATVGTTAALHEGNNR